MDFLPILTYVFWGVLGFFALISMLIGIGRKLPKTIVRLCMVVLSFALAVILSKTLLMGTLKSTILAKVLPMIEGVEGMGDIVAASPTLMEFLPNIILTLVTPIAFMLLFIVLLLITLILGAIINLFFRKLNEKPNRAVPRLLSMIISLICGVIIANGILLPFAGFATTASQLYSDLENKKLIAAENEGVKLAEDIKAMRDKTPVKIVYTLTGTFFDNMLTYQDADGEKVSTLDEVYAIIDIVPPILDVASIDFSDIENLNTKPFKDIVSNLDKSQSVKKIVVEILSYAGQKWADGEAFMGLNVKDQLPEDFANYFDVVFEKLANTTSENLAQNLNELIAEMEALGSIYPDLQNVMNMEFDDISLIDVTPIKSIISKLENTTIIKQIFAQVFADAGGKWVDGEEFMGMNIKASLPTEYEHSLDKALELLKNTTTETLVEDLNVFADTINSVVKAYDYYTSLTDTNITKEEVIDKLHDTLTSITPENVELLTPVVSQETMKNVGLSDESAEVVSSVLQDSLNEISKMDQQAVEVEADAINEVLNYVNPDTAIAVDAEDMIDKISKTSAVKNALIDYTQNPESKALQATEVEKVQISAAIENYKLGENYDAEKDSELLSALESLFNLNQN